MHKSQASIKTVRENPFANIIQLIKDNEDDFVSYVGDETDHGYFYQMPCGLSQKLSPYEKILLVRCLKPEKVLFAVQKYLEMDLG